MLFWCGTRFQKFPLGGCGAIFMSIFDWLVAGQHGCSFMQIEWNQSNRIGSISDWSDLNYSSKAGLHFVKPAHIIWSVRLTKLEC